MIIFSSSIGEAKIEEKLQEVRDLLTSKGGKITTEDFWGLREFSYTIKKEDSGYYWVVNFNMDSRTLKTIEKPLNLNQDILRYLTIKTPADYQLKSLDAYKDEAAQALEESKATEKSEAKAKAEKKDTEPKKSPAKTKVEEADKKLEGIVGDPDITV